MILIKSLLLDCWNSEPDHRPTVNQVVIKLKAITTKKNIEVSQLHNSNIGVEQQITSDTVKVVSENNNLSRGDLTQLIQNFDKMSTNELESIISSSNQIINNPILPENDFSTIVHGIINDIFDKGIE